MSYNKFTDDMMIIRRLGDAPNDENGLSAADLKAKFDEGGEKIKAFLNALIDALNIAEQSGTSVKIDGMDEASVQDATDDTRFAVSIGGTNATLTLRQLKYLIATGAVASVNGKTGDVVLTAKDVGALAPEEDGSLVVKNMLSVYTEDEAGFHMMASGTAEQPVMELGSEQDGEVIVRKVADPVDGSDAVNFRSMEQYVADLPSSVSSVNGQTGEVQLTAQDVGAQPVEADGSVVVQKQVKVLNANGNGGGIVMVAEGDPGDMRVHFHDAISYSSPVRLSNLEEPQSPNDAVTYMFMDKFVQNALQNAGGGTAAAKEAVDAHNVSTDAHGDLRLLIAGLTERLNAVANSSDVELDQLAEIVAYIKSNKSLIDGITTGKVSVSDIVDNLTTNASNKPLSAAQGVALKKYIDDALAEFDGGGGSELVVVTMTQASDGTYTASMTATEIYAEWSAGKIVKLKDSSLVYSLSYAGKTFCMFGLVRAMREYSVTVYEDGRATKVQNILQRGGANEITFSTSDNVNWTCSLNIDQLFSNSLLPSSVAYIRGDPSVVYQASYIDKGNQKAVFSAVTHINGVDAADFFEVTPEGTTRTTIPLSGEDGYTPQRGVDYWTEADKAEIKGYVDEAILGGEW